MVKKRTSSDQDLELLRKLEKRVGGRNKLERLAKGLSFVVERGVFEEIYTDSIRVPSEELFSVSREFCVRNDRIAIAHVGDRFLRKFGTVVEQEIPSDYVRMLELQKKSQVRHMLPYFGGAMGAPLPLAHIFMFLVRANRGTRDFLFFAPDRSGVLYTIRADRNLQGWWIDVGNRVDEYCTYEKGRVVVVRDEPLPPPD